MKYVAFLRGINVSGKNRIPMQLLKEEFTKLGFNNVLTYLNSGNVIFESNKNKDELIYMISNVFNLNIPVAIVTPDDLIDIMNNKPNWWGLDNKNTYDNLIFMIKPMSVDKVIKDIGATIDNEFILGYKDYIYWTFDLKNYQKSNYYKIPNTSINNCVTIRTYNTIKKLIELSKSDN